MTCGAVSGVMPPSTDNAIERPEVTDHPAQGGDLRQLRRQECLATESGIHGHDQDDVDEIEHPRNAFHRRRRIQHDAGAFAVRADELERAVQMRPCFRVHQHMVGAGLGECLDERIDRRDHQVHVERQPGAGTQALQDRRAEADVRHEMAIHHVEMQPIGAGCFDRCHFVLQSREVGREDARRNGDSGGL